METTDTETTADTEQRPGRPGRGAMIALGVVLVAVVGYFALGMPGTDSSGGSMPGMEGMDGSTGSTEGMDGMGSGGSMEGMDQAAPGDPMPLEPDAFQARLADPSAFVVNVHVPASAMIAGTDAAIPYDQISGDARLPAAKDAPILLYCQTGRMSLAAGRELVAAGYTDVSHLAGGMEAWQQAGLPLEGG